MFKEGLSRALSFFPALPLPLSHPLSTSHPPPPLSLSHCLPASLYLCPSFPLSLPPTPTHTHTSHREKKREGVEGEKENVQLWSKGAPAFPSHRHSSMLGHLMKQPVQFKAAKKTFCHQPKMTKRVPSHSRGQPPHRKNTPNVHTNNLETLFINPLIAEANSEWRVPPDFSNKSGKVEALRRQQLRVKRKIVSYRQISQSCGDNRMHWQRCTDMVEMVCRGSKWAGWSKK